MISSYKSEETEVSIEYRENISKEKNVCESLFPHKFNHLLVSMGDWLQKPLEIKIQRLKFFI